MADNTENENKTICLHVKSSAGKKFEVSVKPTDTVHQVKEQLQTLSDITVDQQRLIYAGKILSDQSTIQSYDIQDGHTVHMVKGASSQAQQEAARTTTTRPVPTSSSSMTASAATPANATPAPGAGIGTQAGRPSSAAFNPFDMLGNNDPARFEAMQQQMLDNPEMMNQMMDSPIFQHMMENPEVMRAVVSQNPQMRELLDRNPELGHILEDPQMIRQSMNMMRNPSLMREMMRTNDRAMANIENHPEGFNALRRMYTDIQEPMMNAATDSYQSNMQTNPNPFASLARGADNTGAANNNTNAPLQNPWAPQQGATTTNPTASNASIGTPPAGGMGLPVNMMPDSASMMSMMQDPAMQSALQQMASNPTFVREMVRTNPYLQGLPQVQDLLSNPERLQSFFEPQNLQAMMQLQQSIQQLQGSGLLPPEMMGNPSGMA
eukprot:Ihof_evm26s9 gene=Ihof_evmTU26s9